jgi:hypothetical protein
VIPQQIVRLSLRCKTTEFPVQAAMMRGDKRKYCLVTGNLWTRVRGTLPFEPRKPNSIEYFDDLASLQRVWQSWVWELEDRSREDLADQMRAAWSEFCALN